MKKSKSQRHEEDGTADQVAKGRVLSDIEAMFISDIQPSHNPPIARSAEKDWRAAQERVFDELIQLQTMHRCPLFIAGDVFHKWENPIEFVNWVLGKFAKFPFPVYAIPGNHDLPDHRYVDVHRSCYWTLVEAGLVNNMTPSDYPYELDTLLVWPYPHGFEVKPVENKWKDKLALKIALVHSYIWTESTGYEGADEKARYGKWMKKLKGYDVAFFGDNHNGFLIHKDDKCTVCNCGCLIRRNIDEKSYKPAVSLLQSNGKVRRHLLSIKADKWLSVEDTAVKNLELALDIDLNDFSTELTNLHNENRSYRKIVMNWLEKNDVEKSVRAAMLRALPPIKK